MEEILQSLISTAAAQHPMVLTILVCLGVIRTINKPLFALLHVYVEKTETKRDDEILVEVETSKAYKALSFVLDWTLSIKLPAKKAPEEKDVTPAEEKKSA